MYSTICDTCTVEPPNNGHVGDEHVVQCSEVVPSLEVEMYGQLMEGGKQFVHCREVVLLSECPLSEVLLYYLVCIHTCRLLLLFMSVCSAIETMNALRFVFIHMYIGCKMLPLIQYKLQANNIRLRYMMYIYNYLGIHNG